MSRKLERIQDWKQAGLDAEFVPGTMAVLCGISERQLERHFQEHFQMTPRQWLRRLRCELAKELLATGLTNKAVAEQLKFASESHFCHAFREVFDATPQSFAPAYKPCPASRR